MDPPRGLKRLEPSHPRMIYDPLQHIAGLALCSCLALGSLVPHSLRAQEPEDSDPAAVGDPFLLQEPETPKEFLEAAIQAQQLARPELAKRYLQQFSAAKPSDETLLQLRIELGPVPFQQLANQQELQPLSVEIANRATKLFRERGATPEHLKKLIDDLSGSPTEAFAARRALINTGTQAVPAILERLRTETDLSVRRALLDILVEMGPAVLPPLHAALDAPDNAVRTPALTVIGRLGARDSIPYLYKLAYGPDQSAKIRDLARTTLAKIAATSRVAAEEVEPADVALQLREASLGALNPPAEDPSAAANPPAPKTVPIWTWDSTQNRLRQTAIPANQARLYQAVLFARDAFRIAPKRTETQALYLATRLEWEAAQAGTFEPPVGPRTASGTLLASGPEIAQATLNEAVAAELPRATVGVLGILAQIGSPNLLFGGETGLRAALNAPHPRVQLAAAVAVLRLNPHRNFSESGRIVEILTRALAETGGGTAVIIDPEYQRGATLAAFASELGYDSMVASTGQQGFRLATERITPSFVLVNLNVARWPLSQTIANFRADTRTQSVPIIVVGPSKGSWHAGSVTGTAYAYISGPEDHDPRNAVLRRLTGIPQTGYIVQTTTPDAFYAQIAPILAAYIPTPLTDRDRQQSREIAAFWLAQIADRGLAQRYPLAEAEQALALAISDPKLANNALIALAAIPTASAQQTIAMTLRTGGIDEQQRILAAEMLADHIRRYGLLVDAEMARQIAQNPAQAQSPDLRSAMTALSGLIHSRPVDVPNRLQQLPPLAPPAATKAP